MTAAPAVTGVENVSRAGYAAGTAQVVFCSRRPERLTKTRSRDGGKEDDDAADEESQPEMRGIERGLGGCGDIGVHVRSRRHS